MSKKYLFSLVGVLFFLSVSHALAEAERGTLIAGQLPKQAELSVPGYTVALHAKEAIDGPAFFQEIAMDGSETADSISSKIDAVRLSHFPDAEIQLFIDSDNDTLSASRVPKFSVSGSIFIKRSLHWWNTGRHAGDYFYHCEQCSGAVAFIQMLTGNYNVYRFKNGLWEWRTLLSTTWAGTHTGFFNWYCYGGIADQGFSNAHVAMYFYDIDPGNTGILF